MKTVNNISRRFFLMKMKGLNCTSLLNSNKIWRMDIYRIPCTHFVLFFTNNSASRVLNSCNVCGKISQSLDPKMQCCGSGSEFQSPWCMETGISDIAAKRRINNSVTCTVDSIFSSGKTYTGYFALCAAINRSLDSGWVSLMKLPEKEWLSGT